MPASLTHHGTVRDYTLRVPKGWQQSLEEALAAGRGGLPLLVAFHGGRIGWESTEPGDFDDPEVFQEEWDFTRVWLPPGQVERDFRDQCFVLYPYAVGGHELERDHPDAEDLPLRRWGAWNAGGAFTPNDTAQDDAQFVRALVEHLDARLVARYAATNVGAPPLATVFDPDRRFLFGRSNGAMMALRCVHKHPVDTWAAVFVLSGAIGGSANALVPEAPATFNEPDMPPTARGVSLFAVHGTGDRHVPPGPHLPNPQLEYVSDLVPSVPDLYGAGPGPGVLVATAQDFAPRYLPLRDMITTFQQLNGMAPNSATQSELMGGTRWVKTRPNGLRVVEHRDRRRGHFEVHPDFTPERVWDFFPHHPRPQP